METDAQKYLSISELRPFNGPRSLQHIEKAEDKHAAIRKAAQDFEAIFVAQILKNMRRSLSESGLFGQGLANDIYSSMFDNQIAQAVASKNGFHLSDIIINGLQIDDHNPQVVPELSLSDYRAEAIRRRSVNHAPTAWDRSIIEHAAARYDLDPKLIESVIKVESNFRPNAVSKKGAVGLMQLMKNTATELGVQNRFDPRQNVFGGAKYLKDLITRFDSNLELALSAYNAGPTAVEKYKGIPPYQETQDYVKKVLNHYHGM
ncbi:transglycosylase SLT domain-containing protein [bacterium]|nr:transglycosylase SLT domain-containing protein [bacterium]